MNIGDLSKVRDMKNVSDIHISVGRPATLRINGELIPINDKILGPEDTKKLVYEVLNKKYINELESKGEIDFSYSSSGAGRYRINAFKQKGNYSMVLRIIPMDIPSIEDLGLPSVCGDLTRLRRGLILVTGPTGSGKSTTLASMIDLINKERKCHILTLEDPIEYFHSHNKSLVSQREVGNDSLSFAAALRSALRQDPDVIMVGEMRDLETISIALTAAETGHLVISTLHTSGTAKTIDRIIDVFPPHQQQQIRVQLSGVLQGVISQILLPKSNNQGRVAAFEIMIANQAIKNLIREDKIYQINSAIQTGAKYKMQTMENSLIDLYRKGIIDKATVISNAINSEQIRKSTI